MSTEGLQEGVVEDLLDLGVMFGGIGEPEDRIRFLPHDHLLFKFDRSLFDGATCVLEACGRELEDTIHLTNHSR